MLFRTASQAKPKKAEAVRRSAKNFERPTPTEPLALLGWASKPCGAFVQRSVPLTDKSNSYIPFQGFLGVVGGLFAKSPPA